jgi:folate-binding protein YgfZ
MPAPDATLLQQYEQLKNGSAFVNLDSTVIEITGEDRQAFLHNFCTNEIKGLDAGRACEAFVLNGKGKVIAHVHVLNTGDSLVLHGSAGIGQALVEHLDRYIIREDVELTDVSALKKVTFTPGKSVLDSNRVSVDLESSKVEANIEIAGFGNLLIGQSNVEPVGTEVSIESLEMLRIEERTPWFGRDIDDSNLPQELLRDEKAISFNKGCYLGQETVARIDAMGKVNRVLVAVSMDTELPFGSELKVDDKVMGKLTSAAWSPSQNEWLGMAIVRRPNEITGSILKCDDASVTVIQ